MTKYLFLLLSLLTSSAIAQWPTGEYEAVQLLSKPNWVYLPVAADQAPDGSVRILVQDSPYGTFGFTAGVLAIDREGNLMWPGELADHPVHERDNWMGEANYIMKCGPNGETWVVYEDYYGTPDQGGGYYDTPYISARRFDAQGVPNDERLTVAELNTLHAKIPVHLEVLDDGGMIALWNTKHHEEYEFYEVRAQRYSAECEPLWGDGGLLIYEALEGDSASTWSGLSDGTGGFYFGIGNSLAYLEPSGDLLWDYGDVVVDSASTIISLAWNTDGDEIGLFCGKPLIRYWVSAVNTNGIFIHGPGTYIDHPYLSLSEFYATSSGYNLIDKRDQELYRFDQDLNPIGEIVPLPLVGDASIYQYTYNSHHGIRISTKQRTVPCPNNAWVRAYDHDMNFLWTVKVNEDTTYYHEILPYLDDYGTTWMFWRVADYDLYQADLYMNVADMDGGWGYTKVDEYDPLALLPDDLQPLIYPNPFNNRTTLQFSLNRAGTVSVNIHDILGRTLFTDSFWRAKGDHTESLSFETFPSGIYFINVENGSHRVTVKTTHLK
ncbi:T9SS type A sorting domain-containing protein [bacterium]|nr:T9SS type A sorting domain-containing protein [bacterium]